MLETLSSVCLTVFQALLKKLDAVELDVENFSKKMEELAALCQSLVSHGHFDSANIRDKQSDVEDKYRELLELAAARRRKLVETQKLFEFHREVEDVEAWILEKNAIAGSEDYGTDVEHVQVGTCCLSIIWSSLMWPYLCGKGR